MPIYNHWRVDWNPMARTVHFAIYIVQKNEKIVVIAHELC